MDKLLADYFFPLMGLGALIAAGLLVYILRGQKSAGAVVASADFEPVNFEPVQTDIEAEVRMLVDFGNTAEAIRVVQNKMGLDPNDAKELVGAMEHGVAISTLPNADAPASKNDNDADLRQLASEGKLITAIQLVRERNGLDVKQAKAYVERL